MDYAIIGNGATAALVGMDSSIDWLCLPTFNSPSLFAHLLDDEKGGYFKIKAINEIKREQYYYPKSAILRTVFETKEGSFEINDYMPKYEKYGRDTFAPAEVQRFIRIKSGNPKIQVELLPRPNYAKDDVVSEIHDEYIKLKTAGNFSSYESFYLYTNLVKYDVIESNEIQLERNAFFLLSYHEKLIAPNLETIYLDYTKTKTYWIEWSNRTRAPQKYKNHIIRSAITLKLLSYQETGAVLAAATTSLPEIIGEGRNWDYRYCWPRDSAMMIDVSLKIGHRHSAERFMSFLLDILRTKSETPQIMYGINGEKVLEEIELDHLKGHQNSKPVRIGNAAYRQRQNDIYGELLDVIHTYFISQKRPFTLIDEEIWTVVRSLVREAENVWDKPDNGIWEFRGDLRHFVFSKLLCWVAFDRAKKIAQFLGREKYVEKWTRMAMIIKEDIIKKGFNEELNSFTQSYGSDNLDASNLMMVHYGFLSPDNPMLRGTVMATYEKLTVDNLTFRYMEEDDFGKPKNSFIVCTFWLVEALWVIGEKKKATEIFDNMVACMNRYGLLAEHVEVETKKLTGNFPQGYSHLALIRAALALSGH